jgi:PAS domain S-box-containing protein
VTPTTRYVLLWATLGLGGIVAVTAVTAAPTDPWWIVVLSVLAATVAERIQLVFELPRGRASMTLIEMVITAGLLLLDPISAVAVATVGTGLAATSRRASPPKVLFGATQAAVGTTFAVGVVALLPTFGPTVADRSVVAVSVGMLGYAAVNAIAIVGLFRTLGGPEAVDVVRTQLPLTGATMVGQIATGIVLAAVIELDLALVPFVLAPAAAVYLAARGATRSAELLANVRSDRDRLTRVIDGASDGILLLDREGRVQVWNPAMGDLTGVAASDAVGRPIAEVLHDDRRRADEPVRGRWLIDRAHDAGPRRQVDATLVDADGSARATRESHALMFDERGRCTGDVVVIRDITRQQELERLRSDFVARVSHELRTPLTPIRGFASVLLRRGATISDEQRTDALERIVERADHLGGLVEDLLLVTRLDRGELDEVVHVAPVELRGVLEPLIDDLRVREPARAITFTVAPAVGPAIADEQRVVRIVTALLDNACRYTPVDAPIEVEIDALADDVRVTVRDHGQGIPRQHRDAVFERFSRLEDPLTMRTGGVGLGLFIARQLANAMHGSLTLAPPSAAYGAVFVLSLPAADPLRLQPPEATGVQEAG